MKPETTQAHYKAGNILISRQELSEAVDRGCTAILAGRTAYAIHTTRTGFQISKAYTERGPLPLVGRGRFIMTTAEHANRVIGFGLFSDAKTAQATHHESL